MTEMDEEYGGWLAGMSKRQAWNTILVFCILIFGFTAATLIKPPTEFSETENRSLAQMPKFNVDTLLSGEFESDYETYLTDQFVLRDAWIGLKTDVERAAQKRESKDIYFAEDGYLIERHTGAFATELAQQNIHTLGQFVQQYQGQFGAGHMTVMVAPNAVEILESKLPPFAPRTDEVAYLEQLAGALPGEVWFDTAKILREHDQEELYYRTDHHWTTEAAFYVYREWARAQGFAVPEKENFEIRTVTEEFEGTIQAKLGIHGRKDAIRLYLPREDLFYTVQENDAPEVGYSVYDYTALDTKDKYAVYFGGNQALIKLCMRTDSDRKLLVLKDSYAHCFVPFLLGEFKEVDMIDLRYYNQKLSERIAREGYTDVLFLYNASGFAEDRSVAKLLG